MLLCLYHIPITVVARDYVIIMGTPQPRNSWRNWWRNKTVPEPERNGHASSGIAELISGNEGPVATLMVMFPDIFIFPFMKVKIKDHE